MRDLVKYQRDYATQPYERFQVKNRKRKIRETLDRYPHRRMLEVGCGLEPLFREFSDFDSLVILEPSEDFFRSAEKEIATHAARERVDVFPVTLEQSGSLLAGRKFDLIVISCLLHEVSDPENFLRQIEMLAGQETVVHVNVPNALSFHRLLAVECGLVQSPYALSASNVQFQQATVFDLTQLAALANRCGFSVVESGSYSFKPFTHQQMEDMVQAEILSDQIIEGLYAMEKYIPGCGSEIFVDLKKRSRALAGDGK